MLCCGRLLAEEVLLSDEELERDAATRGVKLRPLESRTNIDERGAFIRPPCHFTTPFGDKEGELKAEAGRYRLLWSKNCNWSNRSSIVIDLLGLRDVISVNIVGHMGKRNKYGWGFSFNEGHVDPVLGTEFLSEVYYNAEPDYAGRCTVPALVDVTTKKVVNNDFQRLTNYFEVAFRPFQPKDAPDLYPEPLREEIDKMNAWLYPNINEGHYRMAFAQSLAAYNEAFEDFYNAMDALEERLETKRFLFGDYVTDSDVRFFTTLARFDIAYYRNLGPIKHRVIDYPNIWGYARDLYEIPAFRNNTYFRYFAAGIGDKTANFADFNTRFADQIDFEAVWSAPQNRKKLSKTPEEKFLRHQD